jgi:hypothetical protein
MVCENPRIVIEICVNPRIVIDVCEGSADRDRWVCENPRIVIDVCVNPRIVIDVSRICGLRSFILSAVQQLVITSAA